MIKTLEKIAWAIFQEDWIEKKLQKLFDKAKKLNEKIGDLAYELITKRDDYATKNDVVFEVSGLKKISRKISADDIIGE